MAGTTKGVDHSDSNNRGRVGSMRMTKISTGLAGAPLPVHVDIPSTAAPVRQMLWPLASVFLALIFFVSPSWCRGARDPVSCDPQKSAPAPDQGAGISRAQGDDILQELKQIRSLLEQIEKFRAAETAKNPGAMAGRTVSLKLEPSHPALGNEKAAVTVVEFTDYQCPYCRRFQNDTFPELKSKYIDTGKIRFITRNLPLAIHPNAKRAAKVARCADEQGKYWDARGPLFEHHADLSANSLAEIAKAAHLAMPDFAACVESSKYDAEVAQEVADAGSSGLVGTPTFVVGQVKGNALSGTVIAGAVPVDTFAKAIEDALAKK